MEKCPILRLRTHLLEEGATNDALEFIHREIEAEMEEAVSYAQASPFPDPVTATQWVFREEV
jgi:pyruvate dehydrogenase E1 component alpha subunit